MRRFVSITSLLLTVLFTSGALGTVEKNVIDEFAYSGIETLIVERAAAFDIDIW